MTIFDDMLGIATAEPEPATALYREFCIYHDKNPRVYVAICGLANDAIAAGHQEWGIASIWEILRWKFVIDAKDMNFKMPNNHRAYYARMWNKEHPRVPLFFRENELRSERRGPRDRYGRVLD
jgi:hypothetical protein